MKALDVVELCAFVLIAVGAGLLSVAWGLIVAGVLLAVWAALRDLR